MTSGIVSNLALRNLYREVRKFRLQPVKKLTFQFDPFHESANAVRNFLFHLSARRVRRTNQACIIKTDIVNDRSEPSISLDLHNGLNVLFKCESLNTFDLAQQFNYLVEKYDIKEEESPIKLKSKVAKRK